MYCAQPLGSSACAESRSFRAALGASLLPAPHPRSANVFTGGCSWERLQVQVHGVPSCRPRGSLGWGCGAAVHGWRWWLCPAQVQLWRQETRRIRQTTRSRAQHTDHDAASLHLVAEGGSPAGMQLGGITSSCRKREEGGRKLHLLLQKEGGSITSSPPRRLVVFY